MEMASIKEEVLVRRNLWLSTTGIRKKTLQRRAGLSAGR